MVLSGPVRLAEPVRLARPVKPTSWSASRFGQAGSPGGPLRLSSQQCCSCRAVQAGHRSYTWLDRFGQAGRVGQAHPYRFWSIHFHIAVVQILAVILANVLKKNLLLLTDAGLPFEMTCNITASFFNRPQVKKDNGYMKVYRPKSIGRGEAGQFGRANCRACWPKKFPGFVFKICIVKFVFPEIKQTHRHKLVLLFFMKGRVLPKMFPLQI